MKSPLKPITKKTNRQTQIVSPLLALVVATLMSATAVQANAELIVHSDVNQIQQSKTVTSAPYIVRKIDDAQSISSTLPTETSIVKLMQVMHIDEQIQSIVDGKQFSFVVFPDDQINLQIA